MIKEIKFTDKAIKQINHLLSQKDKGSFFRITIKGGGCSRSEEHTSELQSLVNLVCRLLLEKKKKKII